MLAKLYLLVPMSATRMFTSSLFSSQNRRLSHQCGKLPYPCQFNTGLDKMLQNVDPGHLLED